MKTAKLILSAAALLFVAGISAKESVRDICGNTYPVVRIGDQYWLGENMKCDKYDTESEAYQADVKEINTSSEIVFTPYFVDATDETKWEAQFSYSENMTEENISKIGYHYNWAAAMGLQTEDEAKRLQPFEGDRQGICPNGWHVPSFDEWNALRQYVEVTDGKGAESAAKHLKTVDGWYTSDGKCKANLDTYKFKMLPCGGSTASTVRFVGKSTAVWSATPNGDEPTGQSAYAANFIYGQDEMSDEEYGTKSYAYPVRCIKNDNGDAVEENMYVSDSSKTYKKVVNGQIIVVKNGKMYNLLGVELK